MNDSAFYYLSNKIRPMIEKRNTIARDAVSTKKRLSATEKSYENLTFSICRNFTCSIIDLTNDQ